MTARICILMTPMCWMLTLWLAGSSAAAGTLPPAPTDRLFAVGGASGPITQGIELVRVADGKVLYSANATTPLCPASVTKLITTAALLHYFGPSHTLATKLYSRGQRRGDTLLGDLIIVGDGDPLMVSESLWQIAADLKNLGLAKITGNLILDNQLFDGRPRDASRLGGSQTSTHAYDAPVTAFGVNFNTFALAIAPGERLGASARVALDPYPVAGVSIENHLVTVSSRERSAVQVTRLSTGQGQAKLVVRGNIPLGSSLRKVYRSVNDPLLSSGEYVRAFLQGQGVVIAGRTLAAPLPQGASLLLARSSEPMSVIVRSLNHFSNNYIADVMVQRLGAAFPLTSSPQPTGTYHNGMEQINIFLQKQVGWQGSFVLKNGSGLAPENRVQAHQVVRLLAYMAKRWDLFPDFVASLPNAGLTGSLEKRFLRGPGAFLRGQVRAKTGTLTEPFMVSALAGYIYHPKHELIAFAILQNASANASQPSIPALHASQEKGLGGLMKHL